MAVAAPPTILCGAAYPQQVPSSFSKFSSPARSLPRPNYFHISFLCSPYSVIVSILRSLPVGAEQRRSNGKPESDAQDRHDALRCASKRHATAAKKPRFLSISCYLFFATRTVLPLGEHPNPAGTTPLDDVMLSNPIFPSPISGTVRSLGSEEAAGSFRQAAGAADIVCVSAESTSRNKRLNDREERHASEANPCPPRLPSP